MKLKQIVTKYLCLIHKQQDVSVLLFAVLILCDVLFCLDYLLFGYCYGVDDVLGLGSFLVQYLQQEITHQIFDELVEGVEVFSQLQVQAQYLLIVAIVPASPNKCQL